MLLFQVTRGVQNGFDSRGMNILKIVLNLNGKPIDVIMTSFNKSMFEHLVRNQTKDFIEEILKCQIETRRISMLLEMVKYKGGVLVYDVKYLSNFMQSQRANRLVIPLVEAVLLSTIPLTDQTRIILIDILDSLSHENPIAILAVFENLIQSDWFDRCSRSKFEAILIRSEKCDREILRVLFGYIVTKYKNTIRTKPVETIFENSEMIKTFNPKLEKMRSDPDDGVSWVASFVQKHFNVKAHANDLTDSSNLRFSGGPIQNFESLKNRLGKNPSSLPILLTLKQALETNLIQADISQYNEIFCLIRQNLNHYCYTVRLLTLKILEFYADEHKNIITELIIAEECPVTLSDYRTRLNALRKIETFLEKQNIGSEIFTRYLTGSLFINFNLLIPETKQFLAANCRRQLQSEEKSDMLNFWLKLLESNMVPRAPADPKNLIFEDKLSNYADELTNFFIPVREGVNEKPDFISFRDHVWNISAHFSDFLEPVSRRLLPVWFDFIQNEFVKEMKFENLLALEEKSGRSKTASDVTRSQTKKMVVNGMRLFAKFQNPAKLFREPELYAFAIELLQSSDVGLQCWEKKFFI